jgi:uncharacterized membrane protein YcaP (DUF421 family)
MGDLNWYAIFNPQVPFAELLVRTSCIFFGCLILFRFIPRKVLAKIGLADLLLIAVFAGAVRNGLVGKSDSVTDCLIVMALLVALDWSIEWMGATFPGLGKLLYPGPIRLVQNGKICKRGLERSMLTEEQLMTRVRAEGLADIRQVLAAFIEANGKITVVKDPRHS